MEKLYELIITEWDNNYKLSLKIDHQTFPVGPETIEDQETVIFWKLMFEKGLNRLIEKQKANYAHR